MKILYVEDNDDNIYVLKKRLTRAGHEVLIAMDGAQGVAMAGSEKPDLILMDLSLPVMNGWDATRQLKAAEETRHIPVIALSAHAMAGARETALEAGCDDFDTKPVELPRLMGKIQALIPGDLMSEGKAGPGEYALLVVDDNEDNRYTLTRRLKREGYTKISVAENGQQALDMVKAQPFDLVLLDIMMPEVNGYEVLERMKADAQLRHVPVIMISAVGEMDSVIRCIELGAEDYLPKPFNPTLLRARVGASLEKKRLRDDIVQHVRRMERDLETAREIQLSMVPTDFPAADNAQGLEVYATLQPAYEVGGDFYDFFWLTPDRLCVLVADVSDKGASAALHMARAKASIRFLCDSEESGYMPNTAELVERIDRELSRDNPHAMFITLLLAVVNARSGEIEWCNAGHNPPCITSAEGVVTVLGGECGIPVGIDPKYFRSAETAQIPKGGSLFVYTDGVTEAMNSQKEMFGVERLDATLRASITAAAQAPREVIAAVLGAVQTFAGEAKPSDDITMLACRWHG